VTKEWRVQLVLKELLEMTEQLVLQDHREIQDQLGLTLPFQVLQDQQDLKEIWDRQVLQDQQVQQEKQKTVFHLEDLSTKFLQKILPQTTTPFGQIVYQM
jgi:hypothetical protein